MKFTGLRRRRLRRDTDPGDEETSHVPVDARTRVVAYRHPSDFGGMGVAADTFIPWLCELSFPVYEINLSAPGRPLAHVGKAVPSSFPHALMLLLSRLPERNCKSTIAMLLRRIPIWASLGTRCRDTARLPSGTRTMSDPPARIASSWAHGTDNQRIPASSSPSAEDLDCSDVRNRCVLSARVDHDSGAESTTRWSQGEGDRQARARPDT